MSDLITTSIQNAQSSLSTALTATAALNAANAVKDATIASLTTQVADLTAKLNIAAPPPPAPAANQTGVTRCFVMTDGTWDQYLNTTDTALQATLRGNIQRLGTFSGFFDSKLAWFPNAYFYFDSYAIYRTQNNDRVTPNPLVSAHPDWILTDISGVQLFIQWRDSDGSLQQFAGDFSNPAFRAWQIAQIKASFDKGYKGLWLDDVNLAMDVCTGSGATARPRDRNTGAAMTDAAWRQYFAEYVEAIRAAFPGKEILHNSVWSTARDLPNDQFVRRQHLAADFINLERGFGDGGIGPGIGIWTLTTLMQYIDFVHSLNRSMVIEDLDAPDEAYSLACYYLIQNGVDYFGDMHVLPNAWPANLKLDLGAVAGGRAYVTNHWQRDFANGLVLVNEPNVGQITVTLPTQMFDESGNAVTSVTIGAKSGRLLRKVVR